MASRKRSWLLVGMAAVVGVAGWFVWFEVLANDPIQPAAKSNELEPHAMSPSKPPDVAGDSYDSSMIDVPDLDVPPTDMGPGGIRGPRPRGTPNAPIQPDLKVDSGEPVDALPIEEGAENRGAVSVADSGQPTSGVEAKVEVPPLSTSPTLFPLKTDEEIAADGAKLFPEGSLPEGAKLGYTSLRRRPKIPTEPGSYELSVKGRLVLVGVAAKPEEMAGLKVVDMLGEGSAIADGTGAFTLVATTTKKRQPKRIDPANYRAGVNPPPSNADDPDKYFVCLAIDTAPYGITGGQTPVSHIWLPLDETNEQGEIVVNVARHERGVLKVSIDYLQVGVAALSTCSLFVNYSLTVGGINSWALIRVPLNGSSEFDFDVPLGKTAMIWCAGIGYRSEGGHGGTVAAKSGVNVLVLKKWDCVLVRGRVTKTVVSEEQSIDVGLERASVSCMDSWETAFTDEKGEFELYCQADKRGPPHQLRFSHADFKTQYVNVKQDASKGSIQTEFWVEVGMK